MKHVYSLLFGLLSLVPTLINAQALSEKVTVTTDIQSPLIASYLSDLEEQGYCVIPQVLSTAEAEALYQCVWHEFIEKVWPNCKMNNRSNWKEIFPMHNKLGIFAGPAGQTQVMWDLRQDPRIVDIFAQIWNTNDLIVSMDGLSLMCPSEIRENDFATWPHVDQTLRHEGNIENTNSSSISFVSESKLKTHPYTIQGQFLFEDSFDGDGGFYCIPKSHLRFTEFAPQLEAISESKIPQNDRYIAQNNYLKDFFSCETDEAGNSYDMKHITAPRGSLILWDSRTVHWNRSASKNRPYRDNPRVRMVSYLCYVPKARLTDKSRALRREAFENGVSTNHNPANPVLKYTKDHIWKEFEQYFEDPSYTQPKINLTPLGESLLGLESCD
ncbi:MAG: phytanoyl-CoA dioxygenase family protein [Parachlamydiaceae bacterium]|nr:phytanoyl-CoA dioxygenase family protein [Parachlamydiaceae bacterium]